MNECELAAAEKAAAEAEALVAGLLKREPEFQSASAIARSAFGRGSSVEKARIMPGLAALAERGWIVARCHGVTFRGRDRRPTGRGWRYAIGADRWDEARAFDRAHQGGKA